MSNSFVLPQSPIGLLDSGVGGITVFQALQQILPHESFIYFGDCAHFPYGNKSAAELIEYICQIATFLIGHRIQMLLIPCHTASTQALSFLQATFSIPIIGMIESTVRALKQTTTDGRIAIMGTEGTIHSGIYQKAIRKELPHATIFPIICSELAQKIELGESDAQELIRSYVKPILGKGIDTVLLACTHYPHIKNEIAQELDSGTFILDPAQSIAEEVKRQLGNRSPSSLNPQHLFYTSGNKEVFQRFLNKRCSKLNYTLEQVDLNPKALAKSAPTA